MSYRRHNKQKATRSSLAHITKNFTKYKDRSVEKQVVPKRRNPNGQ